MSESSITVQIIGWTKFNPRSDVKAPSWFRLEHSLFENPDFYDFTHGEILAWIYVLCIASKKNTSTVTLNFAHAERVGRINSATLLEAIRKLELLQIVRVHVTDTSRGRNANVTDANATDVRTYETDETRRDGTGRDGTGTNVLPLGGVLVNLWQKHSGDLPKVMGTVTKFELDQIRERLSENPDPEYWAGLIKKMAASKFFTGGNNRKWKADFLWLIAPGNHRKVAMRDYGGDAGEVNWGEVFGD